MSEFIGFGFVVIVVAAFLFAINIGMKATDYITNKKWWGKVSIAAISLLFLAVIVICFWPAESRETTGGNLGAIVLPPQQPVTISRVSRVEQEYDVDVVVPVNQGFQNFLDCDQHVFPPPSRVSVYKDRDFFEQLSYVRSDQDDMRTVITCSLKKYFMEKVSLGSPENTLHFYSVPEEHNASDVLPILLMFGGKNYNIAPGKPLEVLTSSRVAEPSVDVSSCANLPVFYEDGDLDQRHKTGQCLLLFVWMEGGEEELKKYMNRKWSCGAGTSRPPTMEFCQTPDFHFLRNTLKFRMHPLTDNWNRPEEELRSFPHFNSLPLDFQYEWIESTQIVNEQ